MRKRMFPSAGPLLFENARRNRFKPTVAEERLWDAYLSQRPAGYKFRRQHPMGLYLADLYCHALKLVIELNGSSHDSPKAQQTDAERQRWLEGQGLTVVRFRNHQVLNELDSVKAIIKNHFPQEQ